MGKGSGSNPDYARAARELRRSSAASRHVPKHRKGTKSERNRTAIRDSQSQGSSS